MLPPACPRSRSTSAARESSRQHQRIGYVAGPEYYLPTRQKAAGRESALRAAGLEPGGLVVYAGNFSVADGREGLRGLLG
ncbi:MAG TPA: hypothetical protein VGJ23_03095 [Gaiellaceae bacterium]